MSLPRFGTLDGNEAVASVAYRLNEVIAVYPITPSSNMGEWADAWAAAGKPNLWGAVPEVVEMQSEAGAAGAVHGALQGGALTTTFTSSQGLLLMVPNLYKIAGELTPMAMHIAARTLATHALSIFGDHSDVMAARATGFALLCSASVQEAQDFALVAQAASLASRIPFLHFFDGFRTSHEVAKIALLSDADLRAMIDEALIAAHRARALTPDRPVVRGTAQNPDVFFQSREACSPFYAACPNAVQEALDRFAALTGRAYRLYEYHGAPEADRVLVLMGSGCDAAHETVDALNARGGNVGVLKVRLFRPFDAARFVQAIPPTARALAVLDRTKEPGAPGEPLYLDCVAAVGEAWRREAGPPPRILGGRYGLSSKEFTPAMIRGVFDHLARERPRNHFTVGIRDDVSGTGLSHDRTYSIEPDDVYRAVFFGLGSDGTVGSAKNSIKIVGDRDDRYAQGYFVYDSKKAGAVTISHLRVSPRPIRSPYLIARAHFTACHHATILDHHDVLEVAAPGGVFLLNTPHGPEAVWGRLPRLAQERIVAGRLRFHVIDADRVARDVGLGRRINTIMQVCFFALSNLLPRDEALEAVRRAVRKTYGAKGEDVVRRNLEAIEQALSHLREVRVPDRVEGAGAAPAPVSSAAPAFVRDVLGAMIAGRGDEIPVSLLPIDGVYPSGTARWEKRNLALEIPVWDTDVCIQCGKCAMVCPHAAIRIKVADPADLAAAPGALKTTDARDLAWAGLRYLIQVAPEDCTGCTLCADICPARAKEEPRLKALHMMPQAPLREQERKNWDFFLSLPELDRRRIRVTSVRQQQVQQPLFEFSGACAGCGETPYLKLLTQLFGDRLIVANATGCSSIYGGNLPTTPWAFNAEGRGPAWCNSLFEDNAEFALGIRLALDQRSAAARDLLRRLAGAVGEDLARAILECPQRDEADVYEQRERVRLLKEKLEPARTADARRLLDLADVLVRKSVWAVGGDGWAYDIGYGGLDHVLAGGRDVKVLVLDTEVYSNTGGQMSKGTPLAAVARFASGGKRLPKKDLGLMAMTYGHVYVAGVALGANDEHTLRALVEAEAYPGPSLVIAYSHCIAHGIDMCDGLQRQKAAVTSGQWILYRYHPDRAQRGENPLRIDSSPPTTPVSAYLEGENRFRMLARGTPEEARRLFEEAQEHVNARRRMYEHLAALRTAPQQQSGAEAPHAAGQPSSVRGGACAPPRSATGVPPPAKPTDIAPPQPMAAPFPPGVTAAPPAAKH